MGRLRIVPGVLLLLINQVCRERPRPRMFGRS